MKCKLGVMSKTEQVNESFKTRYPSAHEKCAGHFKEFKDVWR